MCRSAWRREGPERCGAPPSVALHGGDGRHCEQCDEGVVRQWNYTWVSGVSRYNVCPCPSSSWLPHAPLRWRWCPRTPAGMNVPVATLPTSGSETEPTGAYRWRDRQQLMLKYETGVALHPVSSSERRAPCVRHDGGGAAIHHVWLAGDIHHLAVDRCG